jgi:hypothetical protein
MTGKELFGALTRFGGLAYDSYGLYMLIGVLSPSEGYKAAEYLPNVLVPIALGAILLFAADLLAGLVYRK